MHDITSVNWDVEDIPFVTRETKPSGQSVIFRCNRDFLFYAFKFYQRNRNAWPRHLEDLEYQPLGLKLPFWLLWTMLHVVHIPRLLRKHRLQLIVNQRRITGWFSLMWSLIIPQPVSYETLEREVTSAVTGNYALGINISIVPGGIIDHILFVYGYDDDYYYVLDTHQIPDFPYEKILAGGRFLMKLKKSDITARLGRWSRIWQVVPRE